MFHKVQFAGGISNLMMQKKNENKVENRDLFRESGNFSSDDAKELARGTTSRKNTTGIKSFLKRYMNFLA